MKCQKSRVFEQVRNRGFQTKAQGMPVNVIIIAAIALIVLVVLFAIFTGRMGLFGEGIKATGDPTKTCTGQGGDIEDKCVPGKSAIIAKDIPSGQFCCKD